MCYFHTYTQFFYLPTKTNKSWWEISGMGVGVRFDPSACFLPIPTPWTPNGPGILLGWKLENLSNAIYLSPF